MLVDDEPSIRVVLTAVLQQAGYIVDSAEDGFAALRKIQQTMPDLVITDLRMPNMNGFELLSVIRHRFPNLPTVAISGEFLACQIDEGSLADAFFEKGNYSVPEFLEKIALLLGKPVEHRKPQTSPVWTPTRDAPVMLTCTQCLRSFPIEPCEEGATPPKVIDCVFCGAKLEVQLVAIGLAASTD